jgi:hypothetical protein
MPEIARLGELAQIFDVDADHAHVARDRMRGDLAPELKAAVEQLRVGERAPAAPMERARGERDGRERRERERSGGAERDQ